MAWIRTRYIVPPVVDENQPTWCFGTGGSPAGVEAQPKGSKATQLDGVSGALIDFLNIDGTAAGWIAIPAGGSAWTLQDLGAPAAKQVANIHALFAGNDASNIFPGPFNDPDTSRNLRVTFVAGWDGGDVTVVGECRGEPQTEIFAANPGATVVGTEPFEAVTSATKGAVGINPAAACIGDGDSLGLASLPLSALDTLTADGVNEVGTWGATGTVKPTTAPDGAVVFVAAYPIS